MKPTLANFHAFVADLREVDFFDRVLNDHFSPAVDFPVRRDGAGEVALRADVLECEFVENHHRQVDFPVVSDSLHVREELALAAAPEFPALVQKQGEVLAAGDFDVEE